MQTLSEAFAVVLKERREKQKLSQETLAERAGLHRTYVGLIERGLRKPTLDVARALADGLGVSLTTIMRECEGRLGE